MIFELFSRNLYMIPCDFAFKIFIIAGRSNDTVLEKSACERAVAMSRDCLSSIRQELTPGQTQLLVSFSCDHDYEKEKYY